MPNSSSNPPRTKAFISYSHQDSRWLERLQVHLKPLMRQNDVECWDDTRIKAGHDWKGEISKALETAKVAVLLISADFLASDFVNNDELAPMLAAVEKEGVVILPVIVGPSLFTKLPALSRFQSVNPPNKPLISLTKAHQENVINQVAEAIQEALDYPYEELTEGTQNAPAARKKAIAETAADGTGENSAAKFILDNRLTRYEFLHLKQLNAERPFKYKPRYSFQQELRRLLALGLIERHKGKGVGTAMNDSRSDRDLNEHLYVTDKGRQYLAFMAMIER